MRLPTRATSSPTEYLQPAALVGSDDLDGNWFGGYGPQTARAGKEQSQQQASVADYRTEKSRTTKLLQSSHENRAHLRMKCCTASVAGTEIFSLLSPAGQGDALHSQVAGLRRNDGSAPRRACDETKEQAAETFDMIADRSLKFKEARAGSTRIGQRRTLATQQIRLRNAAFVW